MFEQRKEQKKETSAFEKKGAGQGATESDGDRKGESGAGIGKDQGEVSAVDRAVAELEAGLGGLLGASEQKLAHALGGKSKSQLAQIKAAYSQRNGGATLEQAAKRAFASEPRAQEQLLSLLEGNVRQADALELDKLLHEGLGANIGALRDEKAILDLLLKYPDPKARYDLLAKYEAWSGKSLKEELNRLLKGGDKALATALIDESEAALIRDENQKDAALKEKHQAVLEAQQRAKAKDDSGIVTQALGKLFGHFGDGEKKDSKAQSAVSGAGGPAGSTEQGAQALVRKVMPRSKPDADDIEGNFAYNLMEDHAKKLKRDFRDGRLNSEGVRDKFYSYVDQLTTSAPSARDFADALFQGLLVGMGDPKLQKKANEAYAEREMAKVKFEQAATTGDGKAALAALRVFDTNERRQFLCQFSDALLEKLVSSTNDMESVNQIFYYRFGQSLGSVGSSEKWDPVGLQHLWKILAQLPVEHVSENKSLSGANRVDDKNSGQGSGTSYYDSSSQSVAVNYDTSKADSAQSLLSVVGLGNPLERESLLDQHIRHEVGHAVDHQIHASKTYGRTPAGGGWQEHGAGPPVAEMLERSSGAINRLGSDKRQNIIEVLSKQLRKGRTAAQVLATMPWWKDTSEDERQAILDDPLIKAIEDNRTSQSPWWNGGGTPLGDRVYVESCDNSWSSYLLEARGRKVSEYQLRSPLEWFAEAYTAYYTPDGAGVGAVLGKYDSATKEFFDAHVHSRNKPLDRKPMNPADVESQSKQGSEEGGQA